MVTGTDLSDGAVPTRERIVAAAVELFGRRGYSATAVGEIERAAGLTPRAGGFYKHFPSKRAVLEAAVARRAEAAAGARSLVDGALAGDVASETAALGRAALQIIAADQAVMRIVMREGDNFPELRDQFFERIVRSGHEATAAWLSNAAERAGVPPDAIDVPALASVVLGSIINHCVLRTLFGGDAGVADDRFLAAWTDSTLKLLEANGLLVSDQPDREASE
ncbi:MAG: TetR/AcrR family transcriptional regulator [Solirubrobacterales bacterium]|nr:TetR/AcrR family transcriptional regulator [Solirubrobacterales bacterium]